MLGTFVLAQNIITVQVLISVFAYWQWYINIYHNIFFVYVYAKFCSISDSVSLFFYENDCTLSTHIRYVNV